MNWVRRVANTAMDATSSLGRSANKSNNNKNIATTTTMTVATMANWCSMKAICRRNFCNNCNKWC